MKSFGEFAKVLAKGAAELHTRLVVNLHEIGLHQQVIAAELIGHELPQWPPLADSTIKEKERLGYTGHVSATDPLLRTGENRDSIGFEVDPLELEQVTGSKRKEFLWMEMGTQGPHPVPSRPSLAIAAVSSLPFAGDKLKETAAATLTGEAVRIATKLPAGLIKK